MTAQGRDRAPVAIGLLCCIALLSGACSGANLIAPFDPAIELPESAERTVKVRYTDEDGLPIAAASIRFSLLPNAAAANGALLIDRVAVTGQDGVASVTLKAGAEAAFLVEAAADGAASPAVISVSVAKEAGGTIDVSVYQASAVAVSDAKVLLLDDFECALFDGVEPPPPSNDGIKPEQTVGIQPGVATRLTFRGLKPGNSYTVAAIGRAGDQIVARGCRQGIYITEQMIDEQQARSVSIDLGDWIGPWHSSELALITKFHDDLRLTGVAGLLETVAGLGNGPADHIMDEIVERADHNEAMGELLQRHRDPIAQALAQADGSKHRDRLLAAARALASVKDIQLHSTMSIRDEDDEGVITGELDIWHRMDAFTAVQAHRPGQSVREYFPLRLLADPRLSARRRVFRDTELQLDAAAQMRVEDTGRVFISRHTMSVPIVDAVVGQILFENFGDYKLTRILGAMVDCDQAGQLAHQLAGEMGLYQRDLDEDSFSELIDAPLQVEADELIGGTLTQMCQEALQRVVDAAESHAQEDIEALSSDQSIVFEGSADVEMLRDGVMIGWLRNGNWTGLGTFEGRRD